MKGFEECIHSNKNGKGVIYNNVRGHNAGNRLTRSGQGRGDPERDQRTQKSPGGEKEGEDIAEVADGMR